MATEKNDIDNNQQKEETVDNKLCSILKEYDFYNVCRKENKWIKHLYFVNMFYLCDWWQGFAPWWMTTWYLACNGTNSSWTVSDNYL